MRAITAGKIMMTGIFCIAGAAQGQDSPDFRSEANLLRIPIAATRTSNSSTSNSWRDLKVEDLIVLNDGQKQPARQLWKEADTPLIVGLVVDISGSQAKLVGQHRNDIAQFFDQVLRPGDQAFIVAVAQGVSLIADVSGEKSTLRASLSDVDVTRWQGTALGVQCARGRTQQQSSTGRRVRRGCGGTALWTGVYSSASLMMKPLSGRKALIVLTDGIDTGSPQTLGEATGAAQDAETMVYTIRYPGASSLLIGGPFAKLRAGRNLNKLAEVTGGRSFDATKQELTEIFSEIENDLRNVYVVGLEVPDRKYDGRVHQVEVKSARQDLKVRGQRTYTDTQR